MHEWSAHSRASQDIERAPQFISMETIRFLLVFLKFAEVIVMLHQPFDLDTSAMKDIALAWPHIRVLEFQSSIRHNVPPSHLTLHTLTPLVKHCYELPSLAIDIDASEPCAGSQSIDAISNRNSTIRYLHVGGSLINDTASVAAYIWQLFPKDVKILTSLEHPHGELLSEVAKVLKPQK